VIFADKISCLKTVTNTLNANLFSNRCFFINTSNQILFLFIVLITDQCTYSNALFLLCIQNAIRVQPCQSMFVFKSLYRPGLDNYTAKSSYLVIFMLTGALNLLLS